MSTPQPFPFASLPKEIRLMVYERLPIRTTHIVASRDTESDTSTVLVILRFLERNILATSKAISREAEAILETETSKCGPVQVIVNAPFLEDVAPVLQSLGNTQSALLRMRDSDRAALLRGQKHAQSMLMTEIWRRVSNLQLSIREEIHIGIWVRCEADMYMDTLTATLEENVTLMIIASPGTADLTVDSDWEAVEEFDEEQVEGVFNTFWDDDVAVVESLMPDEMVMEWGARTFRELFEAADERDEAENEMEEAEDEPEELKDEV